MHSLCTVFIFMFKRIIYILYDLGTIRTPFKIIHGAKVTEKKTSMKEIMDCTLHCITMVANTINQTLTYHELKTN